MPADPTHESPDNWTPIDGRCNSRKTDGSGLCRNGAGKGTDHVGFGQCLKHGGRTTNGRKHGAALMTDARVAEMLADYQPGLDEVDPHSDLLEVVALTTGMRRVLTELVGELAPAGTPAYIEYPIESETGDVKVGQPTYRPADPAGIYGPDHKGDGKPHVLVEMLRQWTAENAKAAKLAIDAGIDERRVRIVEEQAEQLGAVVRAVAASLIGRVGELVDDARVVRDLNTQLPTIIRGAIQTARVIDATSEETA